MFHAGGGGVQAARVPLPSSQHRHQDQRHQQLQLHTLSDAGESMYICRKKKEDFYIKLWAETPIFILARWRGPVPSCGRGPCRPWRDAGPGQRGLRPQVGEFIRFYIDSQRAASGFNQVPFKSSFREGCYHTLLDFFEFVKIFAKHTGSKKVQKLFPLVCSNAP